MSSSNAVSPDTLITVKVTYDNNIRRFKLALRDLNAATFESKLRTLLAIPADNNVVFERYSDSIASWVKLDAQNVSVYKQLYRAAKAKLKLRMKATLLTPPTDVLDTSDSASINTLLPSYSSTQVNLPSPESTMASPAAAAEPTPAVDIDAAVALAVSNHFESPKFTERLHETVRTEIVKVAPPPRPAPATPVPVQVQVPTQPPTVDYTTGKLPAMTSGHLGFVIYCNNCDSGVIGEHSHCKTCDSGDFDLCKKCTDKGIHCNDRAHKLFMRELVNGSVRELEARLEPQPKPEPTQMHICNGCGHGVQKAKAISCKTCPDYDLCIACFRSTQGGHDPRHQLLAAEGLKLSSVEKQMLKPGRNVRHHATCDNCDKSIFGIRHKCIDCPDFDFCSDCMPFADTTHPTHRFLPVFGASDVKSLYCVGDAMGVMHYGVYCDGPQCARSGGSGCIRGVRYKCAICPDTDFCSSCEASPLNSHNPTHPLIKMKHAIRHVTVSTTDGTEAVLGDLPVEQPKTETVNSATQVQTVAEVKPTEEPVVEQEIKKEIKQEKVEKVSYTDLKAEFCSDSIPDGTSFPVGQFFTQTFTMLNNGTKPWPKGVSIEFAGGDYMHLKSDKTTLNATTLEHEVAVGEAAQFSVTLSATWPPNKDYISYWILCAPDGTRFGDNIWCSIHVDAEEEDRVSHADDVSTASIADADSIKENNSEAFSSVHETMRRSHESDMIFPKLPVESPVASVENLPAKPAPAVVPAPVSPASHRTFAMSDGGDLEDVDVSSVGDNDQDFLTDEEYDVLDASDEEAFEECERM